MAAENSPSVMKTKKRQLNKVGSDNPSNKKSKTASANPIANKSGKPPVTQGKEVKPFKFKKSDSNKDNKESVKDTPLTKREGRLRAKELAEIRKKKRKRHYTLEQELATLWEKMRQRNISEENRSELASEALKKMKGKISEIASSHVSSRVLQTCIKYCSIEERTAVFEELRPHFLTLACNPYAVHLVKKMLDSVPRKRLAEFISSLHGHVASLLRHMVGSVVVEHAYQMGNAKQKQELLMELYSTELQLFKDQATMKKSGLDEVISKLGLHKGSVSRHMIMVIQPILEKGIVDHSIVHRLLVEYLGIADKTSAMDILQQFSGPLLVRMIHTRDGSRIGVLCVKHGSAKERKKIIKGMKGHVVKIAHDQCGTMVLVSILSIVDDTKLVRKVIIGELQANLKELVLDKSGRRPFLQLLHPNSSRYLSPEDMASLNVSLPSLVAKDSSVEEANPENKKSGEKVTADIELTEEDDAAGLDGEVGDHAAEGGKKDPSVRRQELLVDSGLAKSLVEVCTENAQELLTSAHGREVIFEVATGGAGGILLSSLGDEVKALHEAIASLVAKPKPKAAGEEEEEGAEKEEHVLENFHSSRTIRKLVQDSPSFASTIWEKALKGNNCKIWAKGHSSKVLSAFMESSDSDVREMVKEELQPLVDSGVLKIPQTQKSKNEV